MSKYFSLEELLRSGTAVSKKIENLPSWDVVEHLKELALFLDGLREAWRSPIAVTSGFRCTELNGAIGGANRSAHKLGYAADLQPKNGDMEKFKKVVLKWIKNKKFDQCIIEKSKTAEWIHIGLYNQAGEQRCEVFKLKA